MSAIITILVCVASMLLGMILFIIGDVAKRRICRMHIRIRLRQFMLIAMAFVVISPILPLWQGFGIYAVLAYAIGFLLPTFMYIGKPVYWAN